MGDIHQKIEDLSYHHAQDCDHKGMSELCEVENWGATEEDMKYMCSFFPPGALVARSGGIVVGFALGLPLDDKEAFISLMLIHQDFRRRGLARELLKRCVSSLGERNITLYSSEQGVFLYKKFGFKTDETPTYIYEPKFHPRKEALDDISNGSDSLKIMPLSEVPFNDLMDYDTSIHRIRRETWVKSTVEQQPDSVAAVDDTDRIVGYAGVYSWERNHTQIQPLLADNPSVAAMLLKHVLKVIPQGHEVKFKIPSENPDAVNLMEKIGFSTENDAQPHLIMFSKYRFRADTKKVYSLLNDMNQFA